MERPQNSTAQRRSELPPPPCFHEHIPETARQKIDEQRAPFERISVPSVRYGDQYTIRGGERRALQTKSRRGQDHAMASFRRPLDGGHGTPRSSSSSDISAPAP